MERVKTIMTWYWQTSALVGVPVVFLLLVVGLQKFTFTATCHTIGWRCEYAIGATDAMAAYMGDLIAANPGYDIVAEPTNKRKK
jgi:ABC-type xylose transport system permease subunit